MTKRTLSVNLTRAVCVLLFRLKQFREDQRSDIGINEKKADDKQCTQECTFFWRRNIGGRWDENRKEAIGSWF